MSSKAVKWFQDAVDSSDTSASSVSSGNKDKRLSLLSLPKKKGGKSKKAKKIAGSEDKDASFVVIRNDGGPTHMFRQYHSDGQDSIEMRGLTSARYVVPESAFVLAVTRSGQTEEVDISLDGPLYKPLGANQVNFIGQMVTVTIPGGSRPLVGTVLSITDGQDPTVELVLAESKQNVKTKYITIVQMDPSQALWDQDLQTITVPVPSNVENLFLNYQTNSGTFKWIPKYRALVHPSFQFLISLRCTATVYNQTKEKLRVAILRLRIMRQEEYVSFDAYPEALMMQSAAPAMAKRSLSRAPPREAESAEDQTKTLQEFVSRLPNGELPALKSCRVPLFQLKKVPLVSWYESDVSFRYPTQDSANLVGEAPKWMLRIQNPTTTDSKTASNKNVKNWPAGSIQLLLPGTTDSDVIQPQKVNWLKQTRINAIPAGESDVVQLSSPWNLTLKTKIDVTKTPVSLARLQKEQEAKNPALQLHELVSRIQIEISNSSSGNSRFPLRLRFSTVGYEGLEMATKPSWLPVDLEGKTIPNPTSVSFTLERDGMYWILVVQPLPAGFKQVLFWSLKWTELSTIPIQIRGGRRSGGAGTEGWKMEDPLTTQQLELLTPSQIELPVPVPSDDDEDSDE